MNRFRVGDTVAIWPWGTNPRVSRATVTKALKRKVVVSTDDGAVHEFDGTNGRLYGQSTDVWYTGPHMRVWDEAAETHVAKTQVQNLADRLTRRVAASARSGGRYRIEVALLVMDATPDQLDEIHALLDGEA